MLTDLTKKHLPDFKDSLDARAIQHRDGKGNFEVLQVKTKEGWYPLWCKNNTAFLVAANPYLIDMVDDFLALGTMVKEEVPPKTLVHAKPVEFPVDRITRMNMVVSMISGSLASGNGLWDVTEEAIAGTYNIVDEVIKQG